MKNYKVCLLKNIETNKFHPILFYASSKPSDDINEKYVRHFSIGHFIHGFNSSNEAIFYIKEYYENYKIEDIILDWDGKDINKSICLYLENN